MNENLPIFVGLVHILNDADGRLLLIRNGEDPQWSLPKARLELGKSPTDHLVRSCELMLVCDVQVIGEYQKVHCFQKYARPKEFILDSYVGIVSIGSRLPAGMVAEYATYEEISIRTLCPGTEEIIKSLRKNSLI